MLCVVIHEVAKTPENMAFRRADLVAVVVEEGLASLTGDQVDLESSPLQLAPAR